MKKTKSKITVSSALILLCFAFQNPGLMAQSFDKGTVAINVGIGIGSSISYYSGTGASRTPVISLTGEYGIAKLGPGTVGAGLALGYQGASYTYNSSGPYYYKDKYTTTLFGLRGTYHPDFLNTDKYDVYGVIQLSFDHFGYSFSSNDPYYNYNTGIYNRSSLSSYARAYFLIGGRYYFNKNIGVYAELGYDIAYLKLGLTIKIPGKNTEVKK